MTGSYYAKTDFDFDDSKDASSWSSRHGDTLATRFRLVRVSTSGERYEWDASGGIYVHPYVAILGGYKKVRQTIDSICGDRLPRTPETLRSFSNIDIEGPTIGIAASVPIGHGFGMFTARYAHGFMDAEISDNGAPDEVFDADYDVAEAGFSYTHGMDQLMPHLPLSAATVYAGYRYQNISTGLR